MARGFSITPEIEARVNSIRLKHPDWKPPKIRERLRGDLYLEVKKRPDLLPKLERGWPSESSVRDIKKKATDVENTDEFKAKEKPWCMGTLEQQPISHDALPAVLKVWKLRVARGEDFTVREAKWVARLSVFVQDIELLSWQASHYALNESLYDLAERYFDSTLLDWFFMRIPIPILSRIEEDEQRQEFTFATGLIAEGLKGEPFEEWKAGFLAIIASRKNIKEYLAHAKKVMKEWKAYKKEVQDEGQHKAGS